MTTLVGTSLSCALLVVLSASLGARELVAQSSNPVLRAGYIYADAPFEYAHASTISETNDGLLASWYAGDADQVTSMVLWLSRFDGRNWSAPRRLAAGRDVRNEELPVWNPVLFQPTRGPLLLFYRVGPNPREWWTVVRVSADDGISWSDPVRLPAGYLGPIRTKPVQLSNKDIVMGSSTEYDGWVAHIERFTFPEQSSRTPVDQWLNRLQLASAWTKTEPIHSIRDFAAIQPAVLRHDNEILQVLCRTQQGVVSESWSSDGGSTWSPMVSTGLPNPSAGIDALRLFDGRFLLVSNPTRTGRKKLSVSVSENGIDWREVFVLENGDDEYSYPSAVQTRDGNIHITYTVKPKWMKHVVLDPELIEVPLLTGISEESDSLLVDQ